MKIRPPGNFQLQFSPLNSNLWESNNKFELTEILNYEYPYVAWLMLDSYILNVIITKWMVNVS